MPTGQSSAICIGRQFSIVFVFVSPVAPKTQIYLYCKEFFRNRTRKREREREKLRNFDCQTFVSIFLRPSFMSKWPDQLSLLHYRRE